MSDDKKYNGWTNYETWAVKLWIDNEQGSVEYWEEQAQDAYDKASADKSFTREERAALNLREILKDEYDESEQNLLDNAKAGASIWADLLNAALSEVNWYEIAQSLIEEVEKEEVTASVTSGDRYDEEI